MRKARYGSVGRMIASTWPSARVTPALARRRISSGRPAWQRLPAAAMRARLGRGLRCGRGLIEESAAWATLASASAIRSAARGVSAGSPACDIDRLHGDARGLERAQAATKAVPDGGIQRSERPKIQRADPVSRSWSGGPPLRPGRQPAGASTESRSSGSKPARSGDEHSASRASAPARRCQSSVADSGRTPVRGIRPSVGLSPTDRSRRQGCAPNP